MYRFSLFLPFLAVAGCLFGGGDAGESGDTSVQGLTDEGPLLYYPVVSFDEWHFQDHAVRSYIPSEPKGVVFVFHGSSGGVGFAKKIETVAVLNELILADIGFILTDSTNRGSGQWDTQASFDSNPDLQRLDALYYEVIATTALTQSHAVFTLGFSNGGAMSGHMANYAQEAGWPISGVAPHLSTCWSCSGSNIPTFWIEGALDPHDADPLYEDHLARGIPAEFRVAPEQTISGSWFTRDPSVSEGNSQAAFDELVELGLVDATGVRAVPDDEAERQAEWYQNNGTANGASSRADDLRVAWGLHRMNGYYAREVRDFFLDQR